jgi:pentatricopeptide repeat protein
LLLRLELRDLEFARAEGTGAPAAAAVEALIQRVRPLVDAAPDDGSLRRLLAGALRLQAEIVAPEDLPRAKALLAEALERGQPGRVKGPLQEEEASVGDFALSCMALSALEISREEVLIHRAAGALEPYKNSRNWRVLDPLIRALCKSGDKERAEDLKRQLSSSGYQPAIVWPKNNLTTENKC